MRTAFVALLLLAACSGAPYGSGSSMHVTIVDAQRLLVDGQPSSWEELDAEARKRVADARANSGGKPHVNLDAKAGVSARETNRMIELLAAAGVRSIEILPIRR